MTGLYIVLEGIHAPMGSHLTQLKKLNFDDNEAYQLPFLLTKEDLTDIHITNYYPLLLCTRL